MRARATAKMLKALAGAVGGLFLAALVSLPANAQQAAPSEVSPEFTTQSFAQLGGMPSRLELTPELLSSYIASRQTAQLNSAALDQANALATGGFAPLAPQPAVRRLTPQLLQNYVDNGYQPTAQRIDEVRRERTCLAQAVYHEARGESESGQWAVAEVILNRVASPRYPDTICGVVFQNANLTNRCQFSFACDGQSDDGGNGNRIVRESWVRANLIAEAAIKRLEIDGGEQMNELPATTLYYHNQTVRPSWAANLRSVATIGGHVFYAAL